MLKAPAFLFPTTALFIDDDARYTHLLFDRISSTMHLKSLSQGNFLLENKNNDFIFTDNEPNLRNDTSIEKIIRTSISNRTNYLDDLVSVLIVDLHMDISGLELLYQIKSPFIYKILISNFLDEHEDEIKYAQNQGIIHAAIEKNPNLAHELPKILLTGQNKFFSALSNTMFENNHSCSHLSDTIGATHFINFIEKFKPDYIWPNTDLNVFIFENVSLRQKAIVFITTETEINMLLESENAKSAPFKIIEQLRSGNFMLICENPYTTDGVDWSSFIRPAKKICGSHATFLYNTVYENNSWDM